MLMPMPELSWCGSHSKAQWNDKQKIWMNMIYYQSQSLDDPAMHWVLSHHKLLQESINTCWVLIWSSVCLFVSQPKTLKPKAVLFRQKYMTSVLAVRQKAWVVFFIGTGDGQLIKVCGNTYSEVVLMHACTRCSPMCSVSYLYIVTDVYLMIGKRAMLYRTTDALKSVSSGTILWLKLTNSYFSLLSGAWKIMSNFLHYFW